MIFLAVPVSAVAPVAVNNFGDTRSGGLAGPMALLVILLLALATFLLIRNMNARLRRLPERFPGQDGPDAARATSGPDGSTGRDGEPDHDPAVRRPQAPDA